MTRTAGQSSALVDSHRRCKAAPLGSPRSGLSHSSLHVVPDAVSAVEFARQDYGSCGWMAIHLADSLARLPSRICDTSLSTGLIRFLLSRSLRILAKGRICQFLVSLATTEISTGIKSRHLRAATSGVNADGTEDARGASATRPAREASLIARLTSLTAPTSVARSMTSATSSRSASVDSSVANVDCK